MIAEFHAHSSSFTFCVDKSVSFTRSHLTLFLNADKTPQPHQYAHRLLSHVICGEVTPRDSEILWQLDAAPCRIAIFAFPPSSPGCCISQPAPPPTPFPHRDTWIWDLRASVVNPQFPTGRHVLRRAFYLLGIRMLSRICIVNGRPSEGEALVSCCSLARSSSEQWRSM